MKKSALTESPEYQSFRGSVPLKKVPADPENPDKYWQLYDCGPRDQTCPVVCLPPVSGTADVYFLQCLALSAKGYRVIAVESPPYWSIEEWCKGFRNLLTYLDLEKVHLLGSALGGFLAQKFAEFTRPCPRVASLILCNTFTDTTIFNFAESAQMFWLMPATVLRSIITAGLETAQMDISIGQSVDFMEERLSSLAQTELASRLALNCHPNYVQPQQVNDLPVTIINVWDDSALSQQVKEDLYKCYPHAKLGHLKSGGNFPFLSRSDEFNLFILIHLRNFEQAIP